MNSINKKFKSIQVCFSNYWKYFVFLKSRFPPSAKSKGLGKWWTTSWAQHHGTEHFQPEGSKTHWLCSLDKSALHTSLHLLQKGAVSCICNLHLQLCCFIGLNINCDIVIQKKQATDFVWFIFIPYKISGCLDDYLLKPAIFKCRYTAADFLGESWKLSVSQPNF